MALTPALCGSLGAADKEAGFAAGVSPGDLWALCPAGPG